MSNPGNESTGIPFSNMKEEYERITVGAFSVDKPAVLAWEPISDKSGRIEVNGVFLPKASTDKQGSRNVEVGDRLRIMDISARRVTK